MSSAPDPTTEKRRDASEIAESIAHLASEHEVTVAAAESLTGGAISASLAAASSSSEWFRGAVTAYHSEVKHRVLQVQPGPVISATCAAAMATGVARLLGADLAVAVTGVGGPDPQEDQPPGTVLVAVATPCEVVHSEQLALEGDPGQIVQETTRVALQLLERQLASREDSRAS